MNHRALFCLVALSCLPCVPWKAAAATSPSCPELRARVTDLEQQERVASDAPSRRKRKRELLEARMELGRFCPVAPKTARGKKSGEGGGRPARVPRPIPPDEAIADAEAQLAEVKSEQRKCLGETAAACSLPLENEAAEVSVLLLRALLWKGDATSVQHVRDFVKGGEIVGTHEIGQRFLEAASRDGGKDLQEVVVAAISKLDKKGAPYLLDLINLNLSLDDKDFAEVWRAFLTQKEGKLSESLRLRLREAGSDPSKLQPLVNAAKGSDASLLLDVGAATRVARRAAMERRSQNLGTIFTIISKSDTAACPAAEDFINALGELMSPDPERGIPEPVYVDAVSLPSALDLAACCGRSFHECQKDMKDVSPALLKQLDSAHKVQCEGVLGIALRAGSADGTLRIAEPTQGKLETNFRQIHIPQVDFECTAAVDYAKGAALDFHGRLLDRLTDVATGPVRITVPASPPPVPTGQKVSALRAVWLSGLPEITDSVPGNNRRGWTLAGIDTALVVTGITGVGLSIAERNAVSRGNGSVSHANTLLAVGSGLLISALVERLISGLHYYMAE